MRHYKMECRKCGREVDRMDLHQTYDCQGIPYRLVCDDCMEEIEEKGYDGELYDERDECIDEDY